MNEGVSETHIRGFRAFFFFIVHVFLEYIPATTSSKFIYTTNGSVSLQTTQKCSDTKTFKELEKEGLEKWATEISFLSQTATRNLEE